MYKHSQMQQNPTTPIDMPQEQFYAWFAGITSGEGCFYARVRVTSTGKANINCEFKITLRVDDKPLLDAIQKKLDIGAVHIMKVAPDENQAASFRVTDMSELYNIIIPIFDKYKLSSKKQRDFDIWRQIVQLSITKMTPEKAQQAQYLANQLKAIRNIGLPPKINPQFPA